MQALPYLQLRDSESPASSEKKSYRLSLHETSVKTGQYGDGQTRSGQNVNRSNYSWEDTMPLEGSNSIYFGDIPQFRTPLPSPSPSKILKPSRKVQNQSSLPLWIEPLGVWLTNRKKCNSYETFSRNMELLRRTSDMYLDPCPHIPRCSHERTLSALRRQKQRFQTEEEFKKQERHIRIIERVKQFRELWEQWTDKAKSAGAEHEKRFDSFRKSRDGYIDPDEIIRKKREERIEREKQIRLESEKRRVELLRKKRFRLPKIIVTYYDDKEEKRPLSQCSSLSSKLRLPSLVDIPSGENNKDNESDGESQGRKGDRLALPEIERYCPEEYSEETLHGEDSKTGNETELAAGTDSNPQDGDADVNVQNVVPEDLSEYNAGGEAQNVVDGEVLQDQRENVLKEELVVNNESVLENEHLEDKNVDVIEDVSPHDETEESENDPSSNNEDSKTDVQDMLRLQQDETLEKVDEQCSANNKNDIESLEEKESEGKSEEEENENKEEDKEIQKHYLLPPGVQGMANKNGSEGSINEADDTACLMGACIPVAMGVGNGIIPNDAMRASSVFDRYHVPSQARLNNTRQKRNAGAWRPKINDNKQYLEIDLGVVIKVTQVSTQGYPTPIGVKVPKKDKCWVESYTLAFSTDGSQWQQYTENGSIKVFKGNRDNNSVVISSLSNPVEARFVRFIPQSWKNSIVLRVEVYGEVAEPDLTAVTPSPSSPTTISEEPVHDVILEEEADVEEFVFAVEGEQLEEQDAWEEDTVRSVVETASHMESKVAVISRSPSAMDDFTVQGEKQTAKRKGKSKKPKQDKREENEEKKTKKKKKKKLKEKKAKTPLVTSLSLVEEVEEEEGASSPEEDEDEEHEQEEDTQINSPTPPEIPKRPASVKWVPPAATRSYSMFPERKEENESKPRRRRAETDDSIRSELLRQQFAEDRRRKLAAAMDKPKREIQVQSPVYDSYAGRNHLDDFLTKYCIISEGQANYYRRIFNTFDEDKDGFLYPEEVLEALESVNSNLLSDSHINYIYRVLELCDCSLDAGADFKLFSVVAAFSQRVAVLDEFAKILLSKLDFRELDFKLQKAKRLFLCYVDEAKKTISLEELMLGLTAGGLTSDQREQTLKVLGRTAALDFLDFLTYIPLFIHIHDHILEDPLGTVVYREMLAV